eukprot:Phypoly_transcript_02046.p1 GENE.Phypoly_transcript_02046~~Phypoly_transcript_02046.p1  ORF type:complete len:451 (+),score=61.22 Phypoly_transcript_02046:107-1354(+)
MTEDQLMPLVQQYGSIIELAIIREKHTGDSKGCAFLTYTNKDEAEACIAALHNKHTLPGMNNALQVKWSGSDRSGGGGGGGGRDGGGNRRDHEHGSGSYRNSENKLFVGMIPKALTTEELMPVFTPFGEIEELSILKDDHGRSKGCAFLRYVNRDSAVSCVTALNGALKLPGAPSNLVVKFAESEREKQRSQQQKAAQNQSQMQQMQLLQLANLAPLLTQQLYAQSAWDQYSQQFAGPQGIEGMGGGYNSTPSYGPSSFFGATGGPGAGFGGSGLGGSGLGGGSNLGSPLSGPGPSMGGGNLSGGLSSIASAFMGNNASMPDKEGPPGANLFVYHLPQEFTDLDLYSAFSPFGNIVSAKVYVDKETNQSRGFGFVNYDTPEAAQVAVSQMDGFNMAGKRLKVSVKVNQRLPGRPY